jgi:hypothetical protein
MLQGLDHAVIVVPDIDAAVEAYRGLGFTVVPGGRHPPPGGTHNALVAFADGAYLELIAFYTPTPAHRWWAPLQRGGGLVDLCAGTDDLERDAGALRVAGVPVGPPIERARERPDGYVVRWQLVLPDEPARGVVPFLIRDHTPRAERVPAATHHPNGATGIAGVTIAIPAVERVAAAYAPVLPASGAPVRRADVGGTGVRIGLGPHAVDLLQPDDPASPLAAWLARRGPSPYILSLLRDRGAPEPIDPARAAGARLAWA